MCKHAVGHPGRCPGRAIRNCGATTVPSRAHASRRLPPYASFVPGVPTAPTCARNSHHSGPAPPSHPPSGQPVGRPALPAIRWPTFPYTRTPPARPIVHRNMSRKYSNPDCAHVHTCATYKLRVGYVGRCVISPHDVGAGRILDYTQTGGKRPDRTRLPPHRTHVTCAVDLSLVIPTRYPPRLGNFSSAIPRCWTHTPQRKKVMLYSA